MGLRARIALLVGATVLFATIIAGVGVVLSSRSAGVRLVDDQLQSDADIFVGPGGEIERRILAALAFRESGCGIDDPGDGRPGEGRAGRRGPGGPQGIVPGQFAAALQVVAPTGATVSTCGDLIEPADEELQIANRGRGRSARTLSYDGDRYRVLTLGIGSGGALQVARPLDLADGVVASLVARIVGFGLLGAIVAASLGWILARRAIRPVHELSDTAQRVAATQDLGERISSERDDELGDLATSFNTMLASLDQSRDQQRRFIQDASHELRTPLTSMRTNVELLRRHENIDAPTRERVLADIQLELHELSELSAELVDSATDVSPSTLNPVELELLSIVEGCVERARRRFGRQVDLHVNEPSIVLGRREFADTRRRESCGQCRQIQPRRDID